jgi:uncharacterized protein with von Willebrand factor type A (vWA) domain
MVTDSLDSNAAINAAGIESAVIRFCRLLRDAKIKLPADAAQTALRALAEVVITRREDFRNALLISLLSRPEDRALFMYLFNAFWTMAMNPAPRPAYEGLPGRPLDQESRLTPKPGGGGPEENDSTQGAVRESGGQGAAELEDSSGQTYGVAAAFRGAAVSPAILEPGEVHQRELYRLAGQLTPLLATRRSRRLTRDPLGNVTDMRGTLRGSLRYGGIPVDLRWRRRRISHTRLLLLCDVSRSMDEYTSFFLEFAAAVLHKSWKMEVFLFATEITRVTRLWRRQSFQELRRSIPQCGGGTRIGECLDRFLHGYGNSMLGKGAVVIILSDGLDAGDPAVIDSAMERLHRRSHGVIWLNPLLHLNGYEPRAAGMAAALKHVDLFAPMHDLDSLDQLVRHIRELARRGRGGFRNAALYRASHRVEQGNNRERK